MVRFREPSHGMSISQLTSPQRSLTFHRADTCSAILLQIKPSLNPILVPDLGESAIPGFNVGDLRVRLISLTAWPDLTQMVIYIWLRIRYLTEFMTAIPDKDASRIDDCLFTNKFDILERQILSFLHSDILAKSSSVAFLTAFLNTTLIYIYEELRECPKWTNVCVCLS